MKKLALLIIIALAACSLYADYEYVNSTFSGGFSSVTNKPTIGIGASYQSLEVANNQLSFGLGSKTDIDLVLSDVVNGISIGALLGPAFEINLSSVAAFNISTGFSFYTENTFEEDSIEYSSFGVGFDAAFNYYIDKEDNFGLTVGVSGYLSFMGLDANSRGFRSDISAYVGLSTRSFEDDDLDFFFY